MTNNIAICRFTDPDGHVCTVMCSHSEIPDIVKRYESLGFDEHGFQVCTRNAYQSLGWIFQPPGTEWTYL